MPPQPNIPRNKKHLPFYIDDDHFSEMVGWMRERPPCPNFDGCVNSSARWTYIITDHGIWTDIKVRDNLDGATLTLHQDPDNW
jgi:hypothetical protein